MRLFLTPTVAYARNLWKLLGSNDTDIVLTVTASDLVQIVGVSNPFSPMTGLTKEGSAISNRDGVKEAWLCFDDPMDVYLAYQCFALKPSFPVYVMNIPCVDKTAVTAALERKRAAMGFVSNHSWTESKAAASFMLRKPVNAFRAAYNLSAKAFPYISFDELRLLGLIDKANESDDASEPFVPVSTSLKYADIVGSLASGSSYPEDVEDKLCNLRHSGFVALGDTSKVSEYIFRAEAWCQQYNRAFLTSLDAPKTTYIVPNLEEDFADTSPQMRSILFNVFNKMFVASKVTGAEPNSSAHVLAIRSGGMKALAKLRAQGLVFGRSYLRLTDLGKLFIACFGDRSLPYWEGIANFQHGVFSPEDVRGIITALVDTFSVLETSSVCETCDQKPSVQVVKSQVRLTCQCKSQHTEITTKTVSPLTKAERYLWCSGCNKATMSTVVPGSHTCNICNTTVKWRS